MVKRGEVYLADLSPVVGSEQGGKRPVLIVQNDVGNHSDLNGIRGVYGLGQTMVAELHKNPEYMTVLKW